MFRFCLRRKTEIREGVSKFRPAGQRSGPSWRYPVQGGLKGEEGAQSTTDPSRDADGPGYFCHEKGACLIHRLLAGNAVTVSRLRRLLQKGAEEGRQEKGRALGRAASIQPIEPFKVRLK